MSPSIDRSISSTLSLQRFKSALPAGVRSSSTIRRLAGSGSRVTHPFDSIVLTTSLADCGVMNERSANCAFDERPRPFRTDNAVNWGSVRPWMASASVRRRDTIRSSCPIR